MEKQTVSVIEEQEVDQEEIAVGIAKILITHAQQEYQDILKKNQV